ncbi:MAG: hypothetical protein Q8L24_01145 [bacterium]|nr:hypothetical protein [bacterium]
MLSNQNDLPGDKTIEGYFGFENGQFTLKPHEHRSQANETFADQYQQSGLSEKEFNAAAQDAIRKKIYSFFKSDFEK